MRGESISKSFCIQSLSLPGLPMETLEKQSSAKWNQLWRIDTMARQVNHRPFVWGKSIAWLNFRRGKFERNDPLRVTPVFVPSLKRQCSIPFYGGQSWERETRKSVPKSKTCCSNRFQSRLSSFHSQKVGLCHVPSFFSQSLVTKYERGTK